MLAVKAHVEQGRLKLDEPTSLPEGEIVELVPMAELLARGGDDLDDEERAELHAALDEAEADIAAGRVVSEEEVWATLRANK
jgi:predicted DNA-binding antitoxin AbrB/MazE fold protein